MAKKAKDKREQLMKTVTNSLRESEMEAILKHFQYECALTGKYENVGLDHFIPLFWGEVVQKYEIGGTTKSNTIPFHRSINSSKGAMNPFIWFEKYGERYGISIDKWNNAVEYIAEKHMMTTFDYINRVNACYSEFLAMRWAIDINSKLESEGYIHQVFIDRALKMQLNIAVVIELFGSAETKIYFCDKQTIDLVIERKTLFELRL